VSSQPHNLRWSIPHAWIAKETRPTLGIREEFEPCGDRMRLALESACLVESAQSSTVLPHFRSISPHASARILRSSVDSVTDDARSYRSYYGGSGT
jgi:hypothetical protein